MKHIYSIFAALLLSVHFLFAQTAEISGSVRDADTKEPLAGATVRIEKTKGVVTNAAGKFVLQVPAGDHELIVSFIGYKNNKQSVSLKPDEKQTFDIFLNSAVFQLNQVYAISQYNKNAATETVSTEVIGQDQIKNTNAKDLSEVINKTPGILVQDGQISVRSASSYSYGVGSRTLVLQDGLPLMSADLGDVQSNMAALSNVKQVEVVKGASSAVYGSGAMNGVVNLISQWPTDIDPKTEISTNVGIYDRPPSRYYEYSGAPSFFTNINVNHQRRVNNLQYVVSGNLTAEKSYLQTNDQYRMQTVFKLRYLHPKIEGLNFGLGGSVQYEKSQRFFISKDLDSSFFFLGKGSGDEYVRTNVDPFLSYQTPKGHRFTFNARYINLFRNGNGTDPDAVSHQFYVNPQYQYRWKNMLVITAGVPFDVSSSRSNLYSGINTTFHAAIYAQAEFNYKFLSLQGGLRYEASGVDTAIVKNLPPIARVGINIRAAKATFFRASWGQGYRIPTIGEKYIAQQFTGKVAIVPNHELQLESGWNLELGFKQGFEIGKWKGYFDAAFFWQQSKNFIEYELNVYENPTQDGKKVFPDSIEIYPGHILGIRPLNVENTKIAGYELSVGGTGNIGPVGIKLLAGYTYDWPGKSEQGDTTSYKTGDILKDMFKYNFKRVPDADTSKILDARIRHLVRADIELSYWKCYLGATFAYASYPEKIPGLFKAASAAFFHDAYALDKYGVSHTHGDFVVDLRAGIRPNEHIKLGFIIKNVGNRVYSLRPGKPEPLRNFTLQFAYTF